jgi:hypothetical protein
VSSLKSDAHKVQFTFTPEALEDLDKLEKRIEAPSRAETVRYALRWLQWTVDEIDNGHKICLETEEGIREVMIPFIATKRDFRRHEEVNMANKTRL